MRDKKGICVFNDEWLDDPEFKEWLSRSTGDTEFTCKLCNKSYSLGNMGKGALNSHQKKNATHAKLVALRAETSRDEVSERDVEHVV